MGRKLLNDVDGFLVDRFTGTFTGSFDVSDVDSEYLAYDDEVLMVVRARVKVPRLKEASNGDIIRANVLAVKEAAVVRSDTLKQHLCDALGIEDNQPRMVENPSNRDVDESLESETDVEEFEVVQPAPAAAPKVLKFAPDETVPSVPTEVESIPIKSGKAKDSRLAAFLSEGV